MAGTQGMRKGTNGSPAAHFGRQMRKERMARGWTIAKLSELTKIGAPHLSRVEAGNRPPTERIAHALDKAFGGTWFIDWYTESRTWMPPGFRDWPEIELKAPRLSCWTPSLLDGLVQIEPYARHMFAILPGATEDAITGRTKRRMERQQLILLRPDPPSVRLIVDELSLFRLVTSPDVMTDQLGRLAEIAALPNVVLQVHPARGNPATASGFVLTDNGVYVEHLLGGGVFTDESSVGAVAELCEALRNECYGQAESLWIIERARALWTSESRRIQDLRAGAASKSATRPKRS